MACALASLGRVFLMRRGLAAAVALIAGGGLAVTLAAPAGAAELGHRRLTAWHYATRQEGCWYSWGGAACSPGFDCSGLVMEAYAHAGYRLPHSTYSMPAYLVRIPFSQAKRGDILFFGPGHVALRQWHHTYIDAQQSGTRVKIRRWYPGSGYQPTSVWRLPW